MRDKFIVEIYDNNENLLKTTHYKSYKAIVDDLHIPYHTVRAINYMVEGRMTKKYMHPNLQSLMNTIVIHDNPIY